MPLIGIMKRSAERCTLQLYCTSLIKKEIQLNEICLGHNVRCTVFIRRRTRAQLLMIYKISTYLCPKDERESLKKLNTSPDTDKSLFTTQ